jgi:DNA-binding beta-propeller fold protein YncE
MRALIAAALCTLSLSAIAATPAASAKSSPTKNQKNVPAAPVAPKTGIKTPGIQIPAASLKPDAEIPVETPGAMTVSDSLLVPDESKNVLMRIDLKTNKPLEPIGDLHKPCSGTTIAFGSLWIPSCGGQSVERLDPKTSKVIATLPIGAGDVTAGVAGTADGVWMITDNKTTLSRIDPGQNQVVGEIRIPAGCNSIEFGEASLWVTCPAADRVLRINPFTNLVDQRIQTAGGPRSLAFGAGSVWVLCEKDGKVQRIDPKTNKVIKTLDLAVPNAAGSIAYGENFLWVTQTGFPLTRIDTTTDKEKVEQQFWGEGGGLVSISPGAIWLANVGKGTLWRLDPRRVLATLAE